MNTVSNFNNASGSLKVFLGMCPGVGKTYAMLEAAKQKQREGIRVLVGVVETHGRDETEALLKGLEAVPKKDVLYRDTTVKEMDIDTILTLRPDLVLVDELAHSNVAGCRHPKRYQDIQELLSTGISVYTTVNVQHFESRADAVRQITGIQVRETVPDSFLDHANEIEIVDVTPHILRERLAEGKVYLGERAELAAINFFRPENLTALREMALRYTAERVDRDLRIVMRAQNISGPWKSSERLMVAVGPSPYSASLIRYTCRLAATSNCPWVAIHVDTGLPMSRSDSERLASNLNLARQLGAEIATVSGDSVPRAIIQIAKERNVTQIVVGKSEMGKLTAALKGGSLLDKLLRISGDIDICAVRPIADSPKIEREFRNWKSTIGSWREWVIAGCLILIITGFNIVAAYWVKYETLALFYLVTIVLGALKLSRWPVLALALGCALAWNLIFIPPHYTLTISGAENRFMFGTFIVVALVLGQLTSQLKRREALQRKREEKTEAILELTNNVALATDLEQGLRAALNLIERFFQVRTTIVLRNTTSNSLKTQIEFDTVFVPSIKELSVARWAFDHKLPAGHYTDTLPDVQSLWLPLVVQNNAIGVIGILTEFNNVLSFEETELLQMFCLQLAQLVEKHNILQELKQAELASAADRFRRVLLDSVSHEIKTPLATLQTGLDGLEHDSTNAEKYLREIRTSSKRLNRIVNNILDISRLESGALKPKQEWCDIKELINNAVELTGDAITEHNLSLNVADSMPMIKLDPALIEQSLLNLLYNVAVHTKMGTQVLIEANLKKDKLIISISDNGPGLPPGDVEQLFNPFVRGEGAPTGGSGLGLAIARGFIRAQGGELIAERIESGGAKFIATLPVEVLEES